MELLRGIHARASAALLGAILRSSRHRLDLLLALLERFGRGTGEDRESLRKLRKLLRTDHPFSGFLRRLNTDLSTRCRTKLVSNLIVRGLFQSGRRREEFTKREGFEPPRAVSFAPTSRCNLSCDHCSSAGLAGDELDPNVLIRVIREARDEMGVHFYIMTGGEPFMYGGLLDIIGRFSDCYFQVFTNGTLLDDSMVARLGELGNVLVMVSVEGYEEETDRRRRNGIFNIVEEAMARLRAGGVPFGYSVMETRGNIDTVTGEAFVDWALEHGCLVGYYFHYMPIGNDPDIALLPTPEQRDRSRRNVYRWRNEKPIFLIDVINDGPLTGGCTSSGKQYIHILSSGAVTPCVYSNFSTHSVNEVTLTEALKSPYIATLRRSIPFEGNALRPCLLLDRPGFYFRTLEQFHPRSCIEGEEKRLRDLKADLDKYAGRVREIYDAAWERGDWESIVRSIRWRIGD